MHLASKCARLQLESRQRPVETWLSRKRGLEQKALSFFPDVYVMEHPVYSDGCPFLPLSVRCSIVQGLERII